VRGDALRSLSKFKGEETLAAVKKALDDSSPYVQKLTQKILQENFGDYGRGNGPI